MSLVEESTRKTLHWPSPSPAGLLKAVAGPATDHRRHSIVERIDECRHGWILDS